ncbi:SDR family oxidoreductase [Streptomyces sp. AN091965]|uniref:SDR family oxidoreductase n=1 Tax=Streptomyces sp. AN091965 TaxID=2927803 RepID=UPI001F622019|nr:SDR family oxidoreductase [Streptomyces sp. AN091965]MCI3928246.1 SDR family oxidoreductase [Streptomyces sp. AN091965]
MERNQAGSERLDRPAMPQEEAEISPPYRFQRQQRPGLEASMEVRPRYLAPHYRGSGKLAGKVALITGGDSGIGRSVAVLYAREGADVAIVYLPEEQPDAEETRAAVEAEGRSCLLLPGDLCDPAFCKDVVDRTVAELGGLNVLVSNAAYLNSQNDLSDLTAADFDRVFKTNVYAYFHLLMASLEHLSHGDAVIATASEEALKGSDMMMDYAASKAAMVTFTKSIASHLAQRGVRANVVSPGPTWTVLNVAGQRFPDDYLTHLGSSAPMGRVAQPEEIAPAYVYLASDADSSFTVGEIIAVTGGLTDTR